MDLTGDGDVKAVYLRGASLVAQQIAGQLYYYTFNGHGDVVQRVGQTGAAGPKYKYDAFGNQRGTSETDPNPFRYCGEYYDLETNEIYLRARYYNSSTGRFGSEDSVEGVTAELPNGQKTIDPLSLNGYTYCYNSPVMLSDQNGNWPSLSQVLTAVAIVAVAAITVAAIVASAGAVGVALGGIATSMGIAGTSVLSGGIMTTAAAVSYGTAAAYVVAGGVGVFGVNRAVETVTEKNYMAETVFCGNYQAYETVESLTNLAGMGTITIGGMLPAPSSSKKGSTVTNNVVGSDSSATVDSRKFSEYIFKDGVAPGKEAVFKTLGYDAKHSEMLTEIYQTQGEEQFMAGDYTFGKLDNFGQRINIEIQLKGIGNATGKTSYLKSGWMMYNNNTIKLNTPFTGFTRKG